MSFLWKDLFNIILLVLIYFLVLPINQSSSNKNRCTYFTYPYHLSFKYDK